MSSSNSTAAPPPAAAAAAAEEEEEEDELAPFRFFADEGSGDDDNLRLEGAAEA